MKLRQAKKVLKQIEAGRFHRVSTLRNATTRLSREYACQCIGNFMRKFASSRPYSYSVARVDSLMFDVYKRNVIEASRFMADYLSVFAPSARTKRKAVAR